MRFQELSTLEVFWIVMCFASVVVLWGMWLEVVLTVAMHTSVQKIAGGGGG